MSNLKEKTKKLPDSPGVYFFKNKRGEVIYIGKATSLHDRVRSYFGKDIINTRGPLIQKMVEEISIIDFEKTDSVLEALILEAEKIKKYQPKYNTNEKDDKSFNYVVITKEDYPRVILERQKNLLSDPKPYTLLAIFGPFPHGGQLKDALKIIRKIFPYRDKCTPLQGKACFNKQIGLCPGVCSGEISKQDYRKIIDNIILIFKGKKKAILKKLEKEMKEYAGKQEFEKAQEAKKKINSLKHINDISLIKKPDINSSENFRIESYDVSHTMGKFVVGAMIVSENGNFKKSDYRKFKIRINPGIDDTAALKEILERRLKHSEWPMPNMVVVDGGIAQKRTAELALKQANLNIPVTSVKKDDKHRPAAILGDFGLIRSHSPEILKSNQEVHRFVLAFHKKSRDSLI